LDNKEVREDYFKKIENLDLEAQGGDTLLNQLIYSYLVHHGFAETAKVFSNSMKSWEEREPMEAEGDSEIESHSMKKRQGCQRHRTHPNTLSHGVSKQSGVPLFLYVHLQRISHSILSNGASLLFRLRCQHFVEVIRRALIQSEGSSDWFVQTMEVGQKLQADYSHLEGESKTLLEVIAQCFCFLF